MPKKIKLTRPELKRYRDELGRYERYLPMLKLKQQQLQLTLRELRSKRREAQGAVQAAEGEFRRYRPVLADPAGVNVQDLAKPREIVTSTRNIAGVRIPVFQDVVFPPARYSLFGTPAWVDRTLADLREIGRRRATLEVLERQDQLISKELTRIVQRVNLFEKVKIPEAREGIRRIRIHLGDEMTAAVGRSKLAKTKLMEREAAVLGPEREDAAAEPEA